MRSKLPNKSMSEDKGGADVLRLTPSRLLCANSGPDLQLTYRYVVNPKADEKLAKEDIGDLFAK